MRFKSLSYSLGGGAVAGPMQPYASSHGATIAIGLGGTGVACLQSLKRQVYARIKPDDMIASVPVYHSIKFLAIDSNRYAIESNELCNKLDVDTEYFDISCRDTSNLLAHSEMLSHMPEYKWLPTKGERKIHEMFAAIGTGGLDSLADYC